VLIQLKFVSEIILLYFFFAILLISINIEKNRKAAKMFAAPTLFKVKFN